MKLMPDYWSNYETYFNKEAFDILFFLGPPKEKLIYNYQNMSKEELKKAKIDK